MVSMECHTCHAPGLMSSTLYNQKTMGTGPTFWEKHKMRVDCPECRMEVLEGLLLAHRKIQHTMRRGYRGGTPPPPLRGGPNLLSILPKISVVDPVPGREVPGKGLKLYQPLGSLCSQPCAGHNSDPGGGEPTVPHVPPL